MIKLTHYRVSIVSCFFNSSVEFKAFFSEYVSFSALLNGRLDKGLHAYYNVQHILRA